MKYLVTLIVGILIGASLFGLGLYHNPFTSQTTVSPLAVTTEKVIDLAYTAVPQESILYTDDGDSINQIHPLRTAKLLEPSISDTRIQVVDLQDGSGDLAGIGFKFSTESEQTRLFDAQALGNSVWHIYLPGQGTFMIDQTENYWSYIREVVIPARLSSGKNWIGAYHGVMTSGPSPLGTARVSGGTGRFDNLDSEAVEALTARGYSAVTGPVAMTGSLIITLPEPELPEPEAEVSAEAEE